MRLSKIKLAGFKSFVDPTEIPFTSNLTGIIGPNGCGKSNVIDAVRWVMGESSAKHLRGSSMEDVIFKGSSARAPVGKAYVELVFDNSDGSLAGQYASYAEISVRREVMRDGQSYYTLNGARCRRRDITDIFLGTGLGPRSYAIIEQGMISRLIEAKPDEMRVYLEEAAGISKYKERRRETENRIDHARENISRLEDVLSEINKQMSRLQRQAKTAEKYKTLKQQERKLKTELLSLKWRKLEGAAKEKQHALQMQENVVEAELSKQRAIEADIERCRQTRIEKTERVDQVQSEWYRIGLEVSRCEQAAEHYKEKCERQRRDLAQIETALQQVNATIKEDQQRASDLQSSLDQKTPAYNILKEAQSSSLQCLEEAENLVQICQADWEELHDSYTRNNETVKLEALRHEQLIRVIADLQIRFDRAEEELQQLRVAEIHTEMVEAEKQVSALSADIKHVQAQLHDIKAEHSQCERSNEDLLEQRDRLRHDKQTRQGHLISLEALQHAALGKQNEAVNAWLLANQLTSAPRLGECLQVEPGWELAVEVVLGRYLEAICVEQIDTIRQALQDLKQGHVILVEKNNDSVKTPLDTPQLLQSKIDTAFAVEPWLAGIYIAETLPSALSMCPQLKNHESVITRDGVWVSKYALYIAHEIEEQGSVLKREQDIRKLQLELKRINTDLEQCDSKLVAGRQRAAEIEANKEHLQGQLQQWHAKESEASATLAGLTTRYQQALSRQSGLQEQIAELTAQIQIENDHMEKCKQALSIAESLSQETSRKREILSDRKAALQSELETVKQRVRDEQRELQILAVGVESIRTEQNAVSLNLERIQKQRQELLLSQQALLADTEQKGAPEETIQRELETWLEKRTESERQINAARAELGNVESQLRALEQQCQTCQQNVQYQRELLEKARLQAHEDKIHCQTLLQELEKTGFDWQTLLKVLDDDADASSWEDKVAAVIEQISRLGPINLAAIDEYKEIAERKAYLDTQSKDLTDALSTLESAMTKIDKETRSRFKETFEQVNQCIGEMFPKLFGGGQAYLELTDNDLLKTGVAIMARPPGKRISNIHLLSGGEKALTAVAMVFAIFTLNPAPFCMLDEVDAPLDEANVGRFGDIVKDMSSSVQFIFITHNKATMEMAGQLMGVTMREAGVSRLVSVDISEADAAVANVDHVA